MNKFLAALLLVAIAFGTGSAFTSPAAPAVARRQSTRQAPLGPTFEVPTASSTALNLKVKVDPNAKGNKNVAGNAKMAAYSGSVVIAVLLPVAFLIWSAVSK